MKYWGTGLNTYGQLGLGDYTNKVIFTENSVGDLKVVKCGFRNTTTGSARFSIYLLSDGALYFAGGTSDSNKTDSLVKICDDDFFIDYDSGEWGADTENQFVAVSRDAIYNIVLSYNSTVGTWNATSTRITDANYQWSSLTNIKKVCCNTRSVFIASGDKCYLTTRNFTSPTIYEINAKNIFTTLQNRGWSYTEEGYTYYIQDSQDFLWGFGYNGNGQIIPGGDANYPNPVKVYSSPIKTFSGMGHNLAFIDKSNGLHLIGDTINTYRAIKSIDNDAITTTDSVMSGVSNVWLSFRLQYRAANNFQIFIQKEDGTVWANGFNTTGECGVGTTTNITNGFTKTSTRQYSEIGMGYYYCGNIIFENTLEVDLTVSSPSGATLIMGFNDIPGIKKITLSNSFPATIQIMDNNNEIHDGVIEYSTNREFLGLAIEPNSDTPLYTAGGSYDVQIETNTDLYIVLGEIIINTGFDILTYQYNGENNRVRKNELTGVDGSYKYLTTISAINGTLRDGCSLSSPIITFVSGTIPIFNYVFIQSFGRWYYVKDIKSVRKGLWTMYLKCDVLCTFQTEIYKLNNVVVSRAQKSTLQTPQLEDNYVRTKSNVGKSIIKNSASKFFGNFSSGSATTCFLLDTIGATNPQPDDNE